MPFPHHNNASNVTLLRNISPNASATWDLLEKRPFLPSLLPTPQRKQRQPFYFTQICGGRWKTAVSLPTKTSPCFNLERIFLSIPVLYRGLPTNQFRFILAHVVWINNYLNGRIIQQTSRIKPHFLPDPAHFVSITPNLAVYPAFSVG